MKTRKKKCKVILLPTYKLSGIYKSTRDYTETLNLPSGSTTIIGKKGELSITCLSLQNNKPQHLHIISDDTITKNDCYINEHNEVCQYDGDTELGLFSKKIIASNDNDDLIVARIPKKFIEKYITYHNQGRTIEEVWVEYVSNDVRINSKNDIHIELVEPTFEKALEESDLKSVLTKDECTEEYFQSIVCYLEDNYTISNKIKS